MQINQINAFIRYNIGKKANKRLRKNTIIPGIIYGGNKQNLLIAIEQEKFVNFIKQENCFSSILYITINHNKEKVFIRDIQRHPFKKLINHIDFIRINENKTINVLVKIKIIGMENCKGVKKEGGILVLHKNYIKIKCLPKYIPKFIEINVSNLSLGETVFLKNIYKTNNILFLENNQEIITVKRIIKTV
ncbi:50S ribosomal protein L25 [Candidatus Portiera aleyrodidarum]|uniref:Large ribosomal subunit protein bL25 n=1 Tax=Candidatus Portiera aleyrodidarum TV TaxID=1297582 RepID=A0A8D3X746_9GAMM|nr:50S ribosomal protein L25 [Candidatus Portiera aleyrodidarum]AGI27211.1 ribosomal protein L25 [Candidatus Portiera aleyrodidarum TV]CEI59198.1 50S ribosomal protein L25 [Candidatus Portiera aleyrodidarum]